MKIIAVVIVIFVIGLITEWFILKLADFLNTYHSVNITLYGCGALVGFAFGAIIAGRMAEEDKESSSDEDEESD